MEIKQSEESEQEAEVNSGSSVTSVKPEKSGSTVALVKLIILALLAFVVVKYGVPLMNQISEKSTKVLDTEGAEKPKPAEEKSPNQVVPPVIPANPSIRITKGYEAWESEVREKLGYWVEDGAKYKLLSIEVNDSNDIMEIRYTSQDKEGFSSKEKLVLKKDGFGDRFIYVVRGSDTEGDKEFLVYPPE